jgi:hypothetical protein
MKQTMNPVNVRIEWCMRQSAQARTEPEVDGWRAEADGLRDALMNSDHTDDYRLYPPGIFERYVLGLQDGTALLRAARIERVIHAATVGAPQPAIRMTGDVLLGDHR